MVRWVGSIFFVVRLKKNVENASAESSTDCVVVDAQLCAGSHKARGPSRWRCTTERSAG